MPIADRQAADLDQVNLRRGLLITHDPQYRANPNPYPVSSGARPLVVSLDLSSLAHPATTAQPRRRYMHSVSRPCSRHTAEPADYR